MVTTGPAPAVWRDVVTDLQQEALYLSRRLGHGLVRTPGATGIVNPHTPASVWLHGDVDVDALLAEFAHCPQPELMVPLHGTAVADALDARGWTLTSSDRLGRVASCRPESGPAPSISIQPATRRDLDLMRGVLSRAFGVDGLEYLPDQVLTVPELQIFVGADEGTVVGVAGVRSRHEGCLVFGLATVPRFRRRGVATALVRHCLTWAEQHGAPYAVADVARPASSLWERLDFRAQSQWWRGLAP